jgi:hypothetical protein
MGVCSEGIHDVACGTPPVLLREHNFAIGLRGDHSETSADFPPMTISDHGQTVARFSEKIEIFCALLSGRDIERICSETAISLDSSRADAYKNRILQ